MNVEIKKDKEHYLVYINNKFVGSAENKKEIDEIIEEETNHETMA